jgi:2-methylcitrate dehydratase PrpD
VYTKEVENPYGTPGNPMSYADIVAKFKECCRHAVNPIPVENQEKVIKMIEGLEKLDDAGRIARLLG